jgi:prepilin-type processing-associated H-X9-DG protein
MEIAVPQVADANGVPFMTGSYRGNAGRGDGDVTWYLWEDLPSPAAGGPGRHKGWRGPLHAVLAKGAPDPGGLILKVENIRAITDGTSKTMLAAESTNVFTGRRTFWAWTWGNYLLSQPTPNALSLVGDYCRCSPPNTTGCPNATGVAYGSNNKSCHSSWFSNHPSGMNATMCDGSVRFVAFDIDLLTFVALGSIAGSENETTSGI